MVYTICHSAMTAAFMLQQTFVCSNSKLITGNWSNCLEITALLVYLTQMLQSNVILNSLCPRWYVYAPGLWQVWHQTIILTNKNSMPTGDLGQKLGWNINESLYQIIYMETAVTLHHWCFWWSLVLLAWDTGWYNINACIDNDVISTMSENIDYNHIRVRMSIIHEIKLDNHRWLLTTSRGHQPDCLESTI